MSIVIINVFDAINASTYTFNQYFTDLRNGPSKTSAADNAQTAIDAMSNYWVAQHGGSYIGYDDKEAGFVVKDTAGQVAMVFYSQTLVAANEVNLADRIV